MADPISASISAVSKEILAESLKETALTETPVKSVMNTIENTSLESLKIQNIDSINNFLSGTIHPETKVPYIEKNILTKSGEVSGVFPDFQMHRSFETTLPDNLLTATDARQSGFCNNELKNAFENDQLDKSKFSDRQLEQIKNGDKPEGWTWHHNEELGKMELVQTDIHQKTAHTGGKSIWGGGKEAR